MGLVGWSQLSLIVLQTSVAAGETVVCVSSQSVPAVTPVAVVLVLGGDDEEGRAVLPVAAVTAREGRRHRAGVLERPGSHGDGGHGP